MNRIGILAIVGAMIATYFAMRPEPPAKPFSVVAPMRDRRRGLAKDFAFWNFATVSEPVIFREPSAMDVPKPHLSPVDYPTEVERLLQAGEWKSLNFVLSAWFDEDATAVRDWLAGQESLENYQFALAMIVGKIADAGDPALALEWATLLKPGPEQEQAVFDAYVLAARDHRFTPAQLEAAPLSEERVAELLGGAAGD
jgi:hypothetical protein